MTTPLSPEPRHDDDLPDEAGLRALYGRLPPSEPAPALDATILQAAMQAVCAEASPTLARRRPRWPIALGTAATLVLAAGIAWRMREGPASPPVAPVSEVTAAADAARLDKADGASEAGAAAPRMRGMTAGKGGVDAGHLAPAPALRAKAGTTAVERMLSVPLAAPVASAPPPPPAPPAPPEPMAPAQFAEPAAAPAPTLLHRQEAQALSTELKAIRALYAQGQTGVADRRLRAFHRAHPDHPLPDDLRRHLDSTP
ncbi:MAG: hypothetical protein KGN77_14435 [Xanthomonadaceae bacterium]|nr:hypothetical protein [Xanthomonadaceae bacterium]